MELVDTLALGASAVRREGSSPFIRTIEKRRFHPSFFYDFEDKKRLELLPRGVKVRNAIGISQGRKLILGYACNQLSRGCR